MSSQGENPTIHLSTASTPPSGAADDAEATLRLIASLPAPVGLEDRIFTGVVSAPRKGRVLAWRPDALDAHRTSSGNWMRSAAAAAIVFVVAGGGWGIYSRVEQRQPARVILMPPRLGRQGGFSSAGAIRAPRTIPGPVVKQTARASNPALKTHSRSAATPVRQGQKRTAQMAVRAGK